MGERDAGGGERAMVYCVIPRALAAELHAPLKRFFRDDPAVEVVVERRGSERRAAAERRAAPSARTGERRLIRNLTGRRAGERRAAQVPSEPRELPRRLRRHADQLTFVERIEPAADHLLDLDSARLVIRFQGGEREVFGELYMRYFDRVFSYLRVIFREDPHEAEDLTQQVFTKVLEALPRYERRKQPFRAWLFTIVRNEALQQLGRSRRSDVTDPGTLALKLEGADPLRSPEDAVQALDWITDRELLMFVERLTLPQRQVLLLRYMLDFSTREIAEVLGRTTDDVRMIDSRARRFLEQRLAAVGRAPRGGRTGMQWRTRVRLAPVIRQRRFVLSR